MNTPAAHWNGLHDNSQTLDCTDLDSEKLLYIMSTDYWKQKIGCVFLWFSRVTLQIAFHPITTTLTPLFPLKWTSILQTVISIKFWLAYKCWNEIKLQLLLSHQFIFIDTWKREAKGEKAYQFCTKNYKFLNVTSTHQSVRTPFQLEDFTQPVEVVIALPFKLHL